MTGSERADMTFLYRLGGVTLGTTSPLTTMTPFAENGTPDIEFATSDAPPPAVDGWFLERTREGFERPFMSTARLDEGYLLRIEETHFWLRRDGGRIVAYPGGLAFDAVEQLLLDQVLPQALHLRGRFTLHASAVVTEGVALAFVGQSGDGKSTLASAFVPPDTLLSDDSLTLEARDHDIVAFPGYPSVRLREDSAERFGGQLEQASTRMTWKRRVPLTLAANEATLRRI